MKALRDPTHALSRGLQKIRQQFDVPDSFPPPVLAAAESAAQRRPSAHVDRTDLPFVTLDPISSTDLDQAFAIERSGADLILRYAIADVAWFVTDGDVIDAEAWRRGTTLYLPDGKAELYPPVLSEQAASLLPDGPRPAIIFAVRIDPDGGVRLDGAERAVIRSRAKLGYASVQPSDLPADFGELARRIEDAEQRRGASRVDPPEQEVAAVGGDGFALLFRPRLQAEDDNAALSLAANMAIADALLAHHTGLFRVMAGPTAPAIERLRHTARGLGLTWPGSTPLDAFEHTLDGTDPKQAAFMLAIRRAGDGAAYMPYREGVVPWHAAMHATYAHATAPLRRLADRYVVRAMLAIANGEPVPDAVHDAFEKLPPVMARAGARDGQIDSAVIDLAETVMLQGRKGQIFAAVVTDVDERGGHIQIVDLPIVARLNSAGLTPGEKVRVRLADVDPDQRLLSFAVADA